MRSLLAEPYRRATLVGLEGRGGDSAMALGVMTVLRLALLLLVIANLGRIPVAAIGGRNLPILLNDLVIGTVLAVATLAFAQRRSLRIDDVGVLALLFAAVGALSAALAIPRFGLSVGQVLVSLAYLVRWLVYFAIYVVVVNVARWRDAEPLWRALEAAIMVFASFGIVQSIFLPGFAQMIYPEARAYFDWDPQGHRLVSTFLDPNFAGAFIVIGLVVGLGRLSAGASVAGWKLLLLLAALLMTASRSSVLAFVIGAVTVLVIRGISKRLLRAAAFGSVGLLLALPTILDFARRFNKLQIDGSALARLVEWSRGFTVIADNPILGVGFNTWGFIHHNYGWVVSGEAFTANFGMSGGLLFVTALTGFVGLALYVAMLARIVRRARSVWRDPEQPAVHRGTAIGAAAMVPALVVHSLFTNSIFYPFLMEPLWVLWALPFAMRNGPLTRDASPHGAVGGPRVVAVGAPMGV